MTGFTAYLGMLSLQGESCGPVIELSREPTIRYMTSGTLGNTVHRKLRTMDIVVAGNARIRLIAAGVAVHAGEALVRVLASRNRGMTERRRAPGASA